jgi:glycerophosphoryl diester phosphodiesterase
MSICQGCPHPHNVDTPEDIGRLLEMEVDGLIADDPLLAAAYIRR